MDLKLNDKVVFISAQRFLTEGAQVIINGGTKESVYNAVDYLISIS